MSWTERAIDTLRLSVNAKGYRLRTSHRGPLILYRKDSSGLFVEQWYKADEVGFCGYREAVRLLQENKLREYIETLIAIDLLKNGKS